MYHDSVLNQGSLPLSKSLSGWKRTTASKLSKSQCVHIWQPWASWILRTGPDRTIHRAGLTLSGPPQSSSLFLVSFIFLSALDDHFKLSSPEKKRGQEHHPNRQRLDTPRGIYLLFVGRMNDSHRRLCELQCEPKGNCNLIDKPTGNFGFANNMAISI